MKLHPDETALFMRPYGTTPVGRLISSATALFEPPFGCTLLFSPAADFARLDAMVRSVCGHGLALATLEDGSRRLEMTTEQQPAVVSAAKLPVVDGATGGENAWARAVVRVNRSGEIVLVGLQLMLDRGEEVCRD